MKPIDVDINDYHQIFEMFHSESDRGAVVLAGSYIENYLGIYLCSRMTDKSLEKEIFGANGALSTFSQRIDFSQAFGFLTKEQCAELRLIKKIRNHFAHHPKNASFTDEKVKNWVDSLKSSMEMTMENGEKFKIGELKTAFLISSGFLVAFIHNAMLQP
jgi:hypothetical protein